MRTNSINVTFQPGDEVHATWSATEADPHRACLWIGDVAIFATDGEDLIDAMDKMLDELRNTQES
jgi:hypothetical protein